MARRVLFTSPIVSTLRLSLTTPLSMVVDKILHGSHYFILYVLGAIGVVLRFVVT